LLLPNLSPKYPKKRLPKGITRKLDAKPKEFMKNCRTGSCVGGEKKRFNTTDM
jgi:hypothetical protein